MDRNLEFFASNNGRYSLKVDGSGHPIVFVDDGEGGEGGVSFGLADFLSQTNIGEAKEALLILIGDLVTDCRIGFIKDGAEPTPEAGFIEE